MQLPKLTPLQSRLLASVIATCLLVVIFLWFQPHHFVYAAELDLPPSRSGEYTYDEIPHSLHGDAPILEVDELDGGYEPEFEYFGRSIIGRAPDGVDSLTNNVKVPLDVRPGNTANFVFSREEIEGEKGDPGRGLPLPLDTRGKEETVLDVEKVGNGSKDLGGGDDGIEKDTETVVRRQEGKTVYISINTCRQPTPNGTATTETPPQLTLYVSKSDRNQKPGPDATNNLATEPIEFEGGLAQFQTQSSSDVFVGVSAPSVDRNWNGNWHFEIAASIDGYYHTANDNAFLSLIDTDSTSALFVTHPLTGPNASTSEKKNWMDLAMPFTMYAFPKNNTAMRGLERSACGLEERFRETAIKVDGQMIDRGDDARLPKAQLLVEDLKPSTTYYGYLAVKGNGTTDGLDVPGNAVVNGGGRVFHQFEWTTKSESTCQIIHSLPFCNTIAHAVPANPTLHTRSQLAEIYDTQASALYANFTNSLAQIACNTTGTAQYSLAQNCTTCATAYKAWLCTVLMPRCEDVSATEPWLVARTSSSRNPIISKRIQPGAYKEILPCEDLCNDIVRACPAKLGFECPEGEMRWRSYGRRADLKVKARDVVCSFPGAGRDLNVLRGGSGRLGLGKWWGVFLVVWLVL